MLRTKRAVALWQFIFLLLASSWLWGPQLNHLLSDRTSLISQYESPGQPYAWLFRLSDMLAAALLIMAAGWLAGSRRRNISTWLLLIIGLGMLVDPVFASNCRLDELSCRQHLTPAFIIHATETAITASALFIIAVYDSWRRKTLVSISFVVFQTAYALLLLSQAATQNHFNTISQYIYQLVAVVWLAWYMREGLIGQPKIPLAAARTSLIRNLVSVWAFINGVLAILINLTHHRHLPGEIHRLYFAGDNAWLAQHGVIVGTIMIYLSRQLARGERRARQIFLVICGLEIIKYSLVTPSPLLFLYLITFCGLFILKDEFYRGTIVMTWRKRLKEATFIAISLTLVAVISLVLINRDNEQAEAAAGAIDNFFDYSLRSKVVPKNHLASALLAHTISAFIVVGAGTILWVLFRPTRTPRQSRNDKKVQELLAKCSNSAEDYFKLWPKDKQYFWAVNYDGFIAYKSVGPIAFALADPIAPAAKKLSLARDFITDCRARRLKVCFLPIYPTSLGFYRKLGLNSSEIGSSALIKIDDFLDSVTKDKWWRWKKNRAVKAGYKYQTSLPPHDNELIRKLKTVSDEWLKVGGHQERGFALGYFDSQYVKNCKVYYLTSSGGEIVAFANQPPIFRQTKAITVDLMRYTPEAQDPMPYLLYKIIESSQSEGYKFFDLGFVPFVGSKDLVVNLARILSADRFSAKGLEQFKNKFRPDWQSINLAYDGDLADLALIAIHLERAMDLK
jgi:lysylphosphatidylglycerol synthetase-like protein (DUF2156 family)